MTTQETTAICSALELIHPLFFNSLIHLGDFEAAITFVSSLEGTIPNEILLLLNEMIDTKLQSHRREHHLVESIHEEEYNRVIKHKK